MQKIKYEFADGTTSEIEVTDELYALHLELVQEEKRNHWRETRRHISSTVGKHKQLSNLQDIADINYSTSLKFLRYHFSQLFLRSYAARLYPNVRIISAAVVTESFF